MSRPRFGTSALEALNSGPVNHVETPNNPGRVLCDAAVDLLSRFERPFRFFVTVRGRPPHDQTRHYEIVAKNDHDAALDGMSRFTAEMSAGLKPFLDAGLVK